jgi:hypothetical protein
VPYFDGALLRSSAVNLPAYACLAHTVASIVVFGVLAAVPASWQMAAAVSAVLLVLVTPVPAFVLLFRTSSTRLS